MLAWPSSTLWDKPVFGAREPDPALSCGGWQQGLCLSSLGRERTGLLPSPSVLLSGSWGSEMLGALAS